MYHENNPVSPRMIAERIGSSATYMRKISGLLVKGDILRAHRGSLGGVTLRRPPSEITLLDIMEACQGGMQGDYCLDTSSELLVCAFHKAMMKVHRAKIEVFSQCTLADLVAHPCPSEDDSEMQCPMESPCPLRDEASMSECGDS